MGKAERPEVGARVVYVPGAPVEARGTVIAVGELRGGRWAAMVEWDEGSERRSPEAFTLEAFLVGLVVVEAPEREQQEGG